MNIQASFASLSRATDFFFAQNFDVRKKYIILVIYLLLTLKFYAEAKRISRFFHAKLINNISCIILKYTSYILNKTFI